MPLQLQHHSGTELNVSVKFLALGGADEVGASSYLYDFGGERLLVDAGVRPNTIGPESLPDFSLIGDAAPNGLLLTHAHSDHIGAVPVISRMFPGMPVYGSKATLRLALDMLLDSVKVQRMQGSPLFTVADVQACLERAIVVPVGERFTVGGVGVVPVPAGHLVGAVSYRLEGSAGVVMHLGDVNNSGSLLTEPAFIPSDSPMGPTDVVVTESTYGDTIVHSSRKDEVQRFTRAVGEVLARGGKVLVPAFALGRSTEVAMVLAQHMDGGLIPKVPIVLDGLVRTVHRTLAEDLLDELPQGLRNTYRNNGVNPLLSDHFLFVKDARERRGLIASSEPMVVIASSGMLTAGVSPAYARSILQGERNLLALVGYQDEMAPGRRLLDAAEGAGEVMLPSADGRSLEPVPIVARVMSVSFSGHADAGGLIGLVKRYEPAEVVLVHGDGNARKALGSMLRSSSRRVHWPRNTQEVSLLENRIRTDGLVKRAPAARRRTKIMSFNSTAVAAVRGNSLVLEFPDHVELEHLIGDVAEFHVEFARAGILRVNLKERK